MFLLKNDKTYSVSYFTRGDSMIIKGTSCYENAQSGNLVSITGDGGHAWDFMAMHIKKCHQNYICGNIMKKIQMIY